MFNCLMRQQHRLGKTVHQMHCIGEENEMFVGSAVIAFC